MARQKDGISVSFAATGGTLSPTSATTAGGGIASSTIIGDGIAGSLQITASATLSNGIAVSDTVLVQTTAKAPTIDLVIRNKAGVDIHDPSIGGQFGAAQDLTLEATVRDFDGSELSDEDAGVTVTFEVGGLGEVTNTSDVTERQVCPVNGVKQDTDCAFVVFTSNAIEAVGTISATATINGIVITDDLTVTNTGENSGRADQNSFTITRIVGGTAAATSDTVALEGDLYNTQEASIQVDLADFFNRPVPDGTLVEFTAELGDIDGNCQTVNGNCSVVFTTTEPKSPNNTEVRFRTLDADNCPSEIIYNEASTVSSGVALTDYRVKEILTVYDGATPLVEGVGYNELSNGIDRITCVNGDALSISYRRLWLDEEDDGTSSYVILNPGVATEPFLDVQGTPCLAPARDNVEQISGSINPDGTTKVAGVGTRFLEQLAVGDRLKVHREVRTVSAIASNTSLTVNQAFSDVGNDVSPERIAAPAYLGGMGQPYGARSTILAYARGEESFIDVNGNDEYDFGEEFVDLTEVVFDKNEDNVRGDVNGESSTAGTVGPYRDAGLGTDAPLEAREKSNPYCYGPQTIVGESGDGDDSTEAETYCYQDGGEEDLFIDFDDDKVLDVGNGIYDGSRCLTPLQDHDNDPATADIVVCTTDTLNISASVQILLAGSFAETDFRGPTGGTFGYGEIIQGIANQGGNAITETVAAPEDWTAITANAVELDNTVGARIDTSVLDATPGTTDQEEDVSLFSIPSPFSTSEAEYDISFDVSNYTTGAVEIFVGGTQIALDAACDGPVTCTASDVTLSFTTDLIFAVAESPAGNHRLQATISNVAITGVSTGISGEYRANINVEENDGTSVTDFTVGTGANQVLPGVSERAIAGTVPTLTTTYTSGTFWFTDKYNGQLPDGTTVEIESDNRSGCSLVSVGGIAVDFPDPGPTTGGVHSGTVTVGSTATTLTSFSVIPGAGGGGTITGRVTTPIGNQTVDSISCNLLF